MDSKQQENSVNTIIRFWRKYSSNQCLGCRLLLDYQHRHKSLCHWCDEEANQPVECLYCGSMEENAKNSYPFCDHGECEKRYCRDREDREW